jgi:hypothetical protein
MAIPFPSSPFTGEYFTYGPQTYVWNGFKWIIYISPDGTITESGNTKDSFNQININNTKQFDSFNNRTINFQGINLSIYSGGVNTLVFSAQPQTNSSSTFSGGTVSGPTNFTNGLTANTIYATTYQNLPSSTFSGGTVTGPTNFTNGLTANTISATTYYNLPSSTFSGGTVTEPTNFTGGLSATTISGETFLGNGSGLTNVQNIYNSDGTISSDRYVNISANTLWFSGLTKGFQVRISDENPKSGFIVTSDSLGGPSFSAYDDGSIIIEGPTTLSNTVLFESTVSLINLSPDITSPYLLGLNNSSEITYFDSNLLINSISGVSYSAGTLTFTNNTGGTVDVTGLFTGNTMTGQTSVDFGFTGGGESDYATTVVSNTNILQSSMVMYSVIPSNDHQQTEDSLLDGLTFKTSDIIEGVSFTVNCYSLNNTWGSYNVFYKIIN